MLRLFMRMVVALVVVGCDAASQPRPDILLVTFDTLRADHCSSYGYARETTPRLDRLAREGVRFESAYAPTASTAPSHATLFTGLDPLTHRVRRNGIPLSGHLSTLAELLHAHGYRTAGFPSSFVVNGKFGFAQGFDLYDDDFSDPSNPPAREHEWNGEVIPGGIFRRDARTTTDRAIAWLDGRDVDAGPVFVWLHYIEPHEPYVVPEGTPDAFGAERLPEASLEQVVARYDTLIRIADRQLGRLLDHMSARDGRDGLLAIVTADHGEAFLEHGWRSHAVQIYEESVRIPLAMRWSGVIRRAVVEDVVSLHDVVPTVLGLLGEGGPARTAAGRDLSRALTEADGSPVAGPVVVQRQIYTEDGWVEPIPLRELGGKTFGDGVAVAGEMFGVREGRWKYVEALEETVPRQLFDLEADPRERRNLSEDETVRARSMSEWIKLWRRRHAVADEPDDVELDRVDRERLEALGYVDPVSDRSVTSEE